MRSPFELLWLLVVVSACHSGEPLALLHPRGDGPGLATGSRGCATQVECSSGVCQPDVGHTPRCCAMDCAAIGRVCSTAGDCVCTSQQRETGGLCLLQEGEPCRSPAECAGEQCVDGVCCNGACDGVCERCDAPSQVGVCALHDEDSRCLEKTGFECRARNRCRLPLSLACGSAADCDSEHCAPARSEAPICCNRPCRGVCERCGETGACDAYPATDLGCPALT